MCTSKQFRKQQRRKELLEEKLMEGAPPGPGPGPGLGAAGAAGAGAGVGVAAGEEPAGDGIA